MGQKKRGGEPNVDKTQRCGKSSVENEWEFLTPEPGLIIFMK
jgi:hypothetical protein